MKEFIAYTDFSENSRNAVKYAVAFCIKTKSHLQVMHFLKAPTSAGMLMSVEERMKETALEEMNQLQQMLINEFGDDISKVVEFHVKKGEFIKSINTSFERTKSVFVFVGAKSEYESADLFIGSVAGSVIKQTHVPCLVIPEGVRFSPINKILFSVKKPLIYNKSTIRPLNAIQKSFDSTVDILQTIRDKKKKSVLGPIVRRLNPRIFAKKNTDVLAATQEFLAGKDYNLLCVIRRKKGFFSSFLITTDVPKSVFQIDLPMLVLHGRYD